jgi:hypothetical protein
MWCGHKLPTRYSPVHIFFLICYHRTLRRSKAQVGPQTSYHPQLAPQSPQAALFIMSDNPSLVLKGILDVEIQQKPVPESESIFKH